MMPFANDEVAAFIESVDEALVVEMTASAQFRGLMQKELGLYGEKLSSLLKYNGNPFEPEDVVEGFEVNIIEGGELDHTRTKFVPPAGE